MAEGRLGAALAWAQHPRQDTAKQLMCRPLRGSCPDIAWVMLCHCLLQLQTDGRNALRLASRAVQQPVL
jgi:hypothetical protein